MSRLAILAITIALAASAAQTQSASFMVHPGTAPLGQPLQIVLSNRSATSIALSSSGPWSIYDTNSNPVFSPIVLPAIFYIAPGKSRQWTWDQRDINSVQIPAGAYEVRIVFAIGQTSHTMKAPFIIENVRLAASGTPSPGRRVSLALSAPQAAGLTYRVGLSFSAKPGIPLPVRRELPLAPDSLFFLSMTTGAPIFRAFAGTLNASGGATAHLDVPNQSALKGLDVYAAFAAFDPRAAGGVRTFSSATKIQIR